MDSNRLERVDFLEKRLVRSRLIHRAAAIVALVLVASSLSPPT